MEVKMYYFGVEIETQEFEGVTASDCETTETDWESLNDDVRQAIHDFENYGDQSELPRNWRVDLGQVVCTKCQRFAENNECECEDGECDCCCENVHNLVTLGSFIKQWGIDKANENGFLEFSESDLQNYISDRFVELGNHESVSSDLPNPPDGWEIKEDGTVSGFELIFDGKKDFDDSAAMIKDFYDYYSSVIDEQCSFHIHINRSETTPVYSELFQFFMYRSLWDCRHRIPQSVIYRLADSKWRDKYFGFKIENDRYCAIAYRRKTWEFRLFGNIQNADDGVECLKIAADTYTKATEKMKKINRNPVLKQAETAKVKRRMQDLSKKLERYIQQRITQEKAA
jgi:hypothetical protein